MMSIRRAQATAIERMFGKEPAQAHKTPSWKAFVYDSHGMNVISPLLNVAELRDLGVTVHYRINLSREPLPGQSTPPPSCTHGDADGTRTLPLTQCDVPTLTNLSTLSVRVLLCTTLRTTPFFALERIPTLFQTHMYPHTNSAFKSPYLLTDTCLVVISINPTRLFLCTPTLFLNCLDDPWLDVEAVYMCLPTQDNVKRIIQDMRENVYASYQLNFLTPLPRDLLELLAEATVEIGCVSKVERIFDLYGNFLCLEDDFFTLTESDDDSLSFFALNDPSARDDDIQKCVSQIVDGLFSVFATVGTLPIIFAPPTGSPRYIAEQLTRRFRDHIKGTRGTTLFSRISETGSFQRPVLILLDRQMDLPSILHHTWTYQALVHDVFGIRLNRTVDNVLDTNLPDGSTKGDTFSFERTDRFWHRCRGDPIPTVAERSGQEVVECRRKEQELKSIGGDATATAAEAPDVGEAAAGVDAQQLTAAINSLPEILRQRNFLTAHTSILTKLMQSIEARKLDAFYELEEEIISKKALSRPVTELICDPTQGLLEDRLRLFFIYFLDGDTKPEELSECQQALTQQGCEDPLPSLTYLKSLKELEAMSQAQAPRPQHVGNTLFNIAHAGAGLFSKGVKALLPTYADLPATRVVDAIINCSKDKLVQEYLCFDPKQVHAQPTKTQLKAPAEAAYVFVVGGGNYTEYQNLADYCKRHPDKNVVYGTTQLMNASQLFEQLTRLGVSASTE
eukprot:m.31600 g.31600  ORF g.31600 m.31600 type:complete len:734 (-) comp9433_c0_seq3:215-2416(-)